MKNTLAIQNIFGNEIGISLRTVAKIFMNYPKSAISLAKITGNMRRAENSRGKNMDAGVEVPPLLIVSTTENCNLSCKGCYACKRKDNEALSSERVVTLFDEASELGVSVVMLAGGEPLLSKHWLQAMSEHSELLGLVFTNGTLLDENRIEWFDTYRHVIPVLSIEGGETLTDARRGDGIYKIVTQGMQKLKECGIPFGVSITVTGTNIDEVLSDTFTKQLIENGSRLFIYVEYVPVEVGTEPLVLSKADKLRLNEYADKSAKQFLALFVPFPGDEGMYGGCLAAGRGFVYISSSGNLEPCPFAPFSDQNVKTVSLKEALQSKLLSEVRHNHYLLKEGDGGCALWSNREFIKSTFANL